MHKQYREPCLLHYTKPSISPRAKTDKLYATASFQSSLSGTRRLSKHQRSILQGCGSNRTYQRRSVLRVKRRHSLEIAGQKGPDFTVPSFVYFCTVATDPGVNTSSARVLRNILRTISRYCDGFQRGQSISEAHRRYSGQPVVSSQPSLAIEAALLLSTLPSIDAWRLVEAQASGQARDAGQIQIANAGARVGLISTATALWIACIGTVPRARASECSETLRFSGACSPF